MTVTWTEPARRLAERYAGHGVEALWVLLHTAELAALEMALLPGPDEDLTFTDTALDLREGAGGAGVDPPRAAPWRCAGAKP